MDFGTLRTWLGLPPGPWPPDDRDLLGLAPGTADTGLIEQRALELMDRLRPHQLRYPELATEGMNRIAQAMIALTSGGTAAAPPKPRRPAKRKSRPVEILPESLARPTSESSAVVAMPVSQIPVVLDAEVVTGPAPVIIEVEEVDPGEAVPIPEPPPPGLAYLPADRRESYRKLVALRRLIRVWDRFRHTLAVPGESFLTPVKVLQLLESVDELGRVLPRPFPVEAGRSVLTIATHPLPMGLLRSLVPSQRLAVARDWAQAAAELRSEYASLRTSLRRSSRRRATPRVIRLITRSMRDYPEWVLLLAVVLLFVLGWLRSRTV